MVIWHHYELTNPVDFTPCRISTMNPVAIKSKNLVIAQPCWTCHATL